MKKLFPHMTLAAAVLASAAATAQPVADFGSGLPVEFATNINEDPSVAMNPAGTQFAIAYANAAGDVVLEIRNISDGAIAATDTTLFAQSGFTGDGTIDCAWSPDGTVVAVGWGVGDDGGAAFQLYSALAVPQGSLVSPVDGVNKPVFDFFSDGTVLVAYEGGEGIDGSGVLLRHFATNGTEISSGPTAAASTIAGDQNDAAVAIDRSGGTFATDTILVAWEDSGTTRFVGEDDVNFRVFDSSFAGLSASAPAPAANLLSNAKIGNPAVALASGGEAMIAFEMEGLGGDDETTWGGFLDNAFAPVSANATEMSGNNGARNQSASMAWNASSSSFVAAWSSRGSGASVGFFDASGTQLGSNTALNGVETGNARDADLAVAGDTAVAVWRDNDDDQGLYRIFTIDAGLSAVESWDLYE